MRKVAPVLLAIGVHVETGCTSPGTEGSSDARVQKFVDQLVPADHGQVMRVRGTVEGPIRTIVHEGQRIVSFGLVHNGEHLRVVCSAALPELFREQVEVAAEGRWLEAGEASRVLAAHGLPTNGEIFDARAVRVYLPDF